MSAEAADPLTDEERQNAAAIVIQQQWHLHKAVRDAKFQSAPFALSTTWPSKGTTASGAELESFAAASASYGSHGQNITVAAPTVAGQSPEGDSLAATMTGPEEQRQACVEDYTHLLEERAALLERNLAAQQVLSRFYADQRRRNGEAETTQLTAPEMETTYWGLVRQVGEERRRLAGRNAALERDVAQQRVRYEPIIAEADMQEHNFQQCIHEIAQRVRFTRSNRSIPPEMMADYEAREATAREAIHTARVRHLQLKNRLLRLRKAAKGNQAGAPAAGTSAGDASAAAGAGEGAEAVAASPHMFLIDFEQLKVENTSLNEKIEERAEEVVKLRGKVTHTIHVAAHVREKLHSSRQESTELRTNVSGTDDELNTARDQLARAKRRRDVHLRANTRMRERMPLVGSRELLLDYENRKGVIHEYRTRLVQLTDRHKELTEIIRQQETSVASLQQELSHYPR